MLNRTRFEVANVVIQVVSDALSVPSTGITEATQIVEDLHANSMDIVAIAMGVDDAFDMEVDLNVIPRDGITVGWVVDYVMRNRAT